MKVGVLKRPDGTIRILRQAPGAIAKGRSLEDSINKFKEPDETYEIVDESLIPNDKYFREAWKVSKGKVEIDPSKAAAIKMDRVRIARNEELIVKDAEANKVQETLELAKIDLEECEEEIDFLKTKLEKETDEIRKDELLSLLKKSQLRKNDARVKIHKGREALRKVTSEKQALRDIPQSNDLTKYDLERMKNFVPKELVHRTDVL